MNVQDLEKLLNKSTDRISIFEDKNIFAKYKLKVSDLIKLVDTFFSDEQKVELFKFEHFKKLSTNIRANIIRVISNDNIKVELLEKSDILSDFENYEIMRIVETMGEEGKAQIVSKPVIFKKFDIQGYEIEKVIKGLSDKNKKEILSDKNNIQQELGLDNYIVSNLVASFESEAMKLEMIASYKFNENETEKIVKTFSDKSKTEIVLKNQYEFNKYSLINIVSTLDTDRFINFINENKNFFTENNIRPYEITKRLNKEGQLKLVSKFENLDINIEEKRKILATLDKETKEDIDKSKFPPEYVTAIDMQISDKFSDIDTLGKIIIDFNKDLEIYRGLDEIIAVNPLKMSTENKTKLMELCEICPEIRINDDIGLSTSTSKEYKNGESWIKSVLQQINPEWTDIQKVAFIDHAVGNKISYAPDFDTEVCNECDARALWKIIDSGYGVCNGISQVEKYILNEVGIEAEMVSSSRHAFLKLKDIEIPTKEGKVIKGNTILDPTWNLSAHRYGGKPNNFCRSYEEIRKNDIRSDGKDLYCHINDVALADATLELDEQCLRDVFKSIGIADRDGNFPIKNLIDKSKIIDDYNIPEEEKIKKQLSLIAEYCPEFATCQNSTSSVLEGVVLNQENLKFNKCVVNRVYEKNDENKRPVLYVYADLPEAGKKFYVADKNIKQFLEVPQKEFESKFECYEMDIKKQGGHRPWEVLNEVENTEDLTRSSGKVISSEGEER